jgi:hypothetical protein
MMLKFEVGQDLVIKTKELNVKIISRRPGQQMTTIQTKGENYYEINMGGYITLISEPILELLNQKEEPKPVEIKKTVEKPKKTVKEKKHGKNGRTKKDKRKTKHKR